MIRYQSNHMPWLSKLALVLAACLMLAAGKEARCEGLTVGLHTLSAHVPQHNQYNQNFGIYLRSGSGIETGWYINSFKRNGLYLTQELEVLKTVAGKLGIQGGIVYGYARRCTSWIEARQQPAGKHHDEQPTEYVRTTQCQGFSRGAITPMAGFTYTAPVTVLGVTPRIQFVPSFKGHSSVFHLTLEASL
jgi:hypothetical protein